MTTSTLPERRRLYRRADGRMLGGVAGGLADHLGSDPLRVRIVFAVLAAFSGFGLVLYAALWIFLPSESSARLRADEPAGLAAAERAGRRPAQARQGARRADPGQLVAIGAIGVGLVLLLANTSIGVPLGIAGPLLLAAAGVAIIWTVGDDEGRRRRASLARVGAGALLVAAGVAGFLAAQGGLSAAGTGLVAVAVIAAGVAIVAGPFLYRLLRERDAERHERIVNQERADVAAHLHDSVLQTLALIQKQSDDPRSVVALARAQERDLRGWLYGEQARPAESFSAALAEAAAEVEAAHGTPVEVISVGDTGIDERVAAVVAAVKESMVNAAKHSGADVVDVYAEASGEDLEVFVRDRGKGFDPDAVPDDRMGLRGSVIGRVERHGGAAVVRTAPGDGTEIRLTLRKGTP